MLLDDRPSSSPVPHSLPAGGPDPDRFDWKEAWYPVHYSEDLDRKRPNRFTLLGRDLVIWWDRQGHCWRAFDDQCPHRLAPLSEGRIAEDGLLECPYHGWAFTGEGTCDRIPQQVEGGTGHQSKRACVASLPTAERQGLLFVYAGQAENAEQTKIPVIEPLEDGSPDWVVLNTFRDLPYDALTLLENVLDSSHVPFTHHNSVGNRANAAPVELDLVTFGKEGFVGAWEEGPRKGTLGRQDSVFIAPNLMWHDLTSKQFGRTLTVVYATPMRKGECRLFARFPFKFASQVPATFIKLTPRWFSHIGQNAILEDDQVFLHYQERYLEQRGGSPEFARAFYLPTRADTFVTGLRKWVNEYAGDPFPHTPLPPPRSQAELMDRYHSHTEQCSSCRTALANLKRIRLGAGIGAAIALSTSPLLTLSHPSMAIALLPFLLSVALGAAWLWLGRFERRFYEGRVVPPRNWPEKPRQ